MLILEVEPYRYSKMYDSNLRSVDRKSITITIAQSKEAKRRVKSNKIWAILLDLSLRLASIASYIYI